MNILFICSANMCRSPMADGYLKHLLKQRNIGNIKVQSAAVFFNEAYPATGGARDMATKRGFNLDSHSSQYMDEDLFNWADKIFVMTNSHKHEIAGCYPTKFEPKVFLLGEFDPETDLADRNKDCEIADPYGGNLETYETVFNKIQRSIDHWLNMYMNS